MRLHISGSTFMRFSSRTLLVLAMVLNFLSWAPPQAVQAASIITVNSTQDSLANDGQCTLREAVIAANKDAPSGKKQGECIAGNGADTIEIPASIGEILLTKTDNGNEDSSSTGDLDITASLTINASGPGVRIRGANGYADHIFEIHSGKVVLRGLTLTGGVSKVEGGAIKNKAELLIDNVTITGNSAQGNGGGIYNTTTGNLTVINSTISGNLSNASGGGLYNAGKVTLNNVTVTNNDAGIAGGGIAASGGSFSLWNSIVADNVAGGSWQDCNASLSSAGYDLIGDMNGCIVDSASPGILTGDSLLGALADNGGFTPTHALLTGSPAIDAGHPATPGSDTHACLAVDQRGETRPQSFGCDIGAFELVKPDASVLIRAFSVYASSGSGTTTAIGRLTSTPGETFSIQFYTSPDCDTTTGVPLGEPVSVTTDGSGNVFFNVEINAIAPEGQCLWALTIDTDGNTSDPSAFVRIGRGNDSWPNALRIYPDDPSISYTFELDDFIDLEGQSRWYKFTAQPNSRLVVTLTNLSENYDLTLYKDIALSYNTLTTPTDLVRLGAEFAPNAFSPEAFSPNAFSPEAFSPNAFSPNAFSPNAFSPNAFSPNAFSPEAFSPHAFSPDAFSPDAFSPNAFSPNAFSPNAFSPNAFSPNAFSPNAFSSAQTRSLIGISAFDGLVGEGLLINTWDSQGDFYVRVRGRNGVFDSENPFHLTVIQIPGECIGISSAFPASSITPDAGGYQTLILTNVANMEGSPEEIITMQNRLAAFAGRLEVAGKVIDFSQDPRFQAAQDQVQQHPTCPAAVNLLAGTVKETIDAFWDLNSALKYLVIIGNDEVIPFFRHPDHALLGNEKGYVPPVLDNTTSQASLRLGYVLSQDDYGAAIHISLKDDSIPVPALAVGRLVETALQATGMLDAYLATPDGIVATPSSAFVSGYDFLDDAATAVTAELQAGLGANGMLNTLVSPFGQSPEDPDAWTADQLRAAVLGQRHDLIFLAGHFSASSALAADFVTSMKTSDLLASNVDLVNAIIYSAGCHSGYNIVNSHGVPLVTAEPDWAQAFAQKQATLIAGTGYQYGDTDFIRYSEKLYLDFTQELRAGTGPVAIGDALVKAKQRYLASTPYLRGIDEKALLEATLFGLPMLRIDMPGERLAQTTDPRVVSNTVTFSENPGATLGLDYFDLSVQPALELKSVVLNDVENPGQTSTATYFLGPDGIVSGPNEPALPLALYNVEVPGKVLRGVGFRGGTYSDLDGVLPFTNAPATEIRGVHTPFLSNYFFPVQTWTTNYFSTLAGGDTLLSVFPVQYRSLSPTSIESTQRVFSELDLRLFYSSNIKTYGTEGNLSTPALAAAPSIVKVTSQVVGDAVHFQVQITGDPAAGVQEVWVTYTALSSPLYGTWQSLYLSQNTQNSTLWEEVLPLNGTSAENVRFVVQAVNGVGLVSMDSNQGVYHIPGVDIGAGEATTLSFVPNAGNGVIPAFGRYTEQVTFSAVLTSNGAPLPGKAVAFILGPQSRLAVTDSNGLATTTLSIYALPDINNSARVSFAGDIDYQPSYDAHGFDVQRQFTQITLSPQNPLPASGYPEVAGLLTALLTDVSGRPLGHETLFFVLQGEGETYYEAVISDYAGRATLGALPLPPGDYSVDVYFSGQVPLSVTVNLYDDRYEPAVYTGGMLTLINDPPITGDDLYEINEDTTLEIAAPGLLGNDNDPEGSTLTVSLVSGPMFGTLQLSADGSFIYTPQANFNGSDTFTYGASDGRDTTQGTVTINVLPVNDAPTAYGESYTTLEETELTVAAPGVLNNDLDVDGDALTAVLLEPPANGTLTFNPDGSFSYLPEPEYNGSVTLTYQASDGLLLSAPVTVGIEVVAVNDPPNCLGAMPSPDSLWPANSQFIKISIINLTDPEGDPFSIVINQVFQDEPVGNEPDAMIKGDTVDLRSERDGNGNGRVYHIYFTAADIYGASCPGEVVIGVVAHDQSGNDVPFDDGALFDSTIAQ